MRCEFVAHGGVVVVQPLGFGVAEHGALDEAGVNRAEGQRFEVEVVAEGGFSRTFDAAVCHQVFDADAIGRGGTDRVRWR